MGQVLACEHDGYNHLQAIIQLTMLVYRYVWCHFSQEWTKLERPVEAPWPVERYGHAACCLNYGEEYPQLLVIGGWNKNETILNDACILDVKSGSWKSVGDDAHI